ncbi:MAG: hypothetical protein V3W28_00420 [Thermoplasmata archaeon]
MTQVYGHNNPPFQVLTLDEEEYKYLKDFLIKKKEENKKAFEEVCSMSNKDPRSRQRSLLIMNRTVDDTMLNVLLEKMDDTSG